MTSKACIFNIQPYSINDGPGVRSTIFIKGCPLRCKWCHNPESNLMRPQLMFYSTKCIGCGRCADLCPQQAAHIVDGKAKTDRYLCTDCGKCTDICLMGAREIAGKMKTAEAVFHEIVKDKQYYQSSGGGITISGGEPLTKPDFCVELIEMCVKEGIHTAIETCGYASIDSVKQVFTKLDLVFMDLKALNSELHKALTGCSNELILKNMQYAYHDMKKNMVIRIPIVPGLNDGKENIQESSLFIRDKLSEKVHVQLLPYHAMGNSKLENLENNNEQPYITVPSDAYMEMIKNEMEEYGLKNVQIGSTM